MRPQRFDFLELVDDALCGFVHFSERLTKVSNLGVVEPVIAVDDTRRGCNEVFVFLARRLLLVDHAANAQAVRDAAHELGIAHFLQKRAGGRPRLDGFVAQEGRAPDLHPVDPLWVVVIGAENDERAVGIEAETVASERVIDFFPDHVVRKKDRAPGLALVKGVEDVFAVR